MPRAQTSVVIRTRLVSLMTWVGTDILALRDQWTYEVPPRNSAMIASRSFCAISPCMDDTVKLDARIFSVNQSTCRNKVNHLLWEKKRESHFSACVAENHCLSDSEGIVQVTQGVEFPIFLFNSDEELFDAFKGQFVTFHKNSNGIGHELCRHLQNVIGQCCAKQNNLSCRREVSIHVIDLVLETLVEELVSFIEHEHFDISCS